jgi:membrane associated rhomboid family serine protease
VRNQWLIVSGLLNAYIAGRLYLRAAPPSHADRSLALHHARATLTFVLVIGLSAIFQLFFPWLRPALERNATLIASGEWWRLVTALFVQDGGIAGSIFNLVSLLLVGRVAERMWGSRRWLAVFAVGGILSEVVALAWRPIGAGNSVANFSLAGAVSILCIVRRTTRPAVVAAGIALAACAALLLLRDIHGAAALSGAMTGLVFVSVSSDMAWWPAGP